MRLDIRPGAAPLLTNLTASPGIKCVVLHWDVPSDKSYKAAQVYVNTVNDPSTAILVATVAGSSYTYNLDDATNRYYWVKAVNIYDRADGPFSNGVAGSGKLVTGTDIAPGAIDLATQVTGKLASGNITGLGALAVLDTLGVAKITGLGALATANSVTTGQVSGLGTLATQNTVNANTQVTNLGDLAYANSLAANQIGAGTLAAGVIYAGTISADKVTAGTLTGHTIKTSASGQRITINENSNNVVTAYNGANTVVAQFGGSSGGCVYGAAGTGILPGMYGTSAYSNGSATPLLGGINGYSSSDGYGVWGDSSSGPGIRASSTSGNAILITRGVNGIVQNGGGPNYLFQVNPNGDNSYDCGASAFRWRNLYVASGVISTSDARTKTDIANTDLGLDFIDALRPVKYRQAIAQNVVTFETVELEPAREFVDDSGNAVQTPAVTEERRIVTPHAGVRYHYGLISQEVREAMLAHGVDDAAFWALEDPADPDSRQALRYEELLSPLIKAVQELSAQVVAQQARIAALEGRAG